MHQTSVITLKPFLNHSPLNFCSSRLAGVRGEKEGTDSLEEFLDRDVYPVTSIHGDRSQRNREEALRQFRFGHTPILVATMMVARGLNIPQVKYVFDFDLPVGHRRVRAPHRGCMGKPALFFNKKNRKTWSKPSRSCPRVARGVMSHDPSRGG